MFTSSAAFRRCLIAIVLTWVWLPEGAATAAGHRVDCRAAAGAEALAQTLCAAVAARLGPEAPPVTVELMSSPPRAISARLGILGDGGLRWGETVTLEVIDRDTLPPRALQRLADALLKLAADPADRD